MSWFKVRDSYLSKFSKLKEQAMAADYIREKLNIKSFLLRGRNANKKLGVLAFQDNQQDAGFTLLEVIVVAIMVGILAAIAAPGWLGFVNRQRVNKGNDAVLSAIQQAQREAKNKKVNYSVSFKTDNNHIPQFAVYQVTTPLTNPLPWQNLIDGAGNKAKQIVLLTNLTATNQTATTGALNPNYDFLDTPKSITFDYIGSLPDADFGGVNGSGDAPGLKIAVVTRKAGTSASANDMKRCVIVKTLLGTMITHKDDQCD
jgi:prepilin-type N-terminal cleavage/methylation domain-containing protein